MNDARLKAFCSWMLILFSLLYVGIPLLVNIVLHESYLLFSGSPKMIVPVVLGAETALHFWFSIYTFLPLMLVPALICVRQIFRNESRTYVDIACVFLLLAIIGKMFGGMLLPSFNWTIGYFERTMSTEAQQILVAVANAMNTYAVKYLEIGFGGLCFSIWFVMMGLLLRHTKDTRTWISILLIVLGVLFFVLVLIEATLKDISYLQWFDLKAIAALWFFVFGLAVRWVDSAQA
ncbi:MAG: hypothetical protein ACE365_00800 [Gammaproteobacteria bacterium]